MMRLASTRGVGNAPAGLVRRAKHHLSFPSKALLVSSCLETLAGRRFHATAGSQWIPAHADSSDFYRRLGASPAASQHELHSRFQAIARTLHPDVCADAGADVRFRRVSAAYQTLADRELRERYDAATASSSARSHADRSEAGGRNAGSTSQQTSRADRQRKSAAAGRRTCRHRSHHQEQWNDDPVVRFYEWAFDRVEWWKWLRTRFLRVAATCALLWVGLWLHVIVEGLIRGTLFTEFSSLVKGTWELLCAPPLPKRKTAEPTFEYPEEEQWERIVWAYTLRKEHADRQPGASMELMIANEEVLTDVTC